MGTTKRHQAAPAEPPWRTGRHRTRASFGGRQGQPGAYKHTAQKGGADLGPVGCRGSCEAPRVGSSTVRGRDSVSLLPERSWLHGMMARSNGGRRQLCHLPPAVAELWRVSFSSSTCRCAWCQGLPQHIFS